MHSTLRLQQWVSCFIIQEQMGNACNEEDCLFVVSPSAPGEEAGKQSQTLYHLWWVLDRTVLHCIPQNKQAHWLDACIQILCIWLDFIYNQVFQFGWLGFLQVILANLDSLPFHRIFSWKWSRILVVCLHFLLAILCLPSQYFYNKIIVMQPTSRWNCSILYQ